MLELRGVTKVFGEFKALDTVDLSIGEGEIVGLLGENGAGKSTLMNIVGGVLAPTAGHLRWDNQPVTFASPRDATGRGIGVVHQHFMLVPVFTVAENIALHAPQSGPLLHTAEWNKRVQDWAQSLGWKIAGNRRTSELSVGELQRVEILKALFAHSVQRQDANTQNQKAARLLLLDEPTANLTPTEVTELFATLRRLREQKLSIVFVSHKLNEVLDLCDRIVVLRHGRVVGERDAKATAVEELASLMVGREFQRTARQPAQLPATAAPRLTIKHLSCGLLRDFSLTAHTGEIIGLAGVDGNGQRELVEVLSGLRVPEVGNFVVTPGNGISDKSTAPITSIAVIPPDRQTTGLIQAFDLAENMALHPGLREECRGHWRFDWTMARAKTRTLMQQFNVRAPATAERTLAGNLSGGNQQKIVIARALAFPHAVVVAADPARGLDIAATQFVHEQLRKAAADGAAVLLISTDLDEILQLSDRIGVLYEGQLLPDSELLPAQTDREAIGALMGGQRLEP